MTPDSSVRQVGAPTRVETAPKIIRHPFVPGVISHSAFLGCLFGVVCPGLLGNQEARASESANLPLPCFRQTHALTGFSRSLDIRAVPPSVILAVSRARACAVSWRNPSSVIWSGLDTDFSPVQEVITRIRISRTASGM